MTVATLCELFLDLCKRNREPRPYDFYVSQLWSFVDFVGRSIRISDLLRYHVTQWLATLNVGEISLSQ
jgi:hypothetical protein